MNKPLPFALLMSQMCGQCRERRIGWIRRARDYKRLDSTGLMVRTCVRYARESHHEYLRYKQAAWDAYDGAMEDRK